MECVKILHTGAISHGAISYPSHVSIAAGINLLRVFIWAKENKNIARLMHQLGPRVIFTYTNYFKETFALLLKLNIYYGPRSFFMLGKEFDIDHPVEKEYIG